MYILIIGGGRTGNRIAELATADQHEVVVIERDEERAAALSATYDCLVLHANAASRTILEEAGVQEADAVIATTDDDAINLMVMMLSRDLGTARLLSSINNPDHIALFEGLGVQLVESPHRLSGEHLYRSVQRPRVRDFMALGNGAEILELSLAEGASLDALTLAEAGRRNLLPDETIVVVVQRREAVIVPKGDTTLQAGDLVTVFSRHGATPELLKAFAEQRGW